MKRVNQAGDTIVEVLVAIAMISLILAGAFVSSNRSFVVNQRSQERGEATKFVEQQLERLKVAANSPTSGIFDTGVTGPYCLDNNLTRQTGAVCNFGVDGRYPLSITRNGNDFLVRTSWVQANGGGNDIVELSYRLYP